MQSKKSFKLLLLRQQDTKAIMRDEKTHEEEEERGQWTNPCDFFISCLGYAVGLGDTSCDKTTS